MSKKDVGKVLGAAARILLAWAFVFSQTAWAAQTQNQKQNPEPTRKAGAQAAPVKESASKPAKTDTEETESAVKQSTAEESNSRSGPHEGIKVHGHWTIEVRNPDGTRVTHREFENSLTPPGATLSAMLSRAATTGIWEVAVEDVIAGGSPSGLCTQLVSNTAACTITEPGNPFGSYSSTNLTVAGGYSGTVTLNGSVVVTSPGTINVVQSFLATCPATVAPSACPTSNTSIGGIAFSSAAVNPSLNVAAGQTIAVTVTLSFS